MKNDFAGFPTLLVICMYTASLLLYDSSRLIWINENNFIVSLSLTLRGQVFSIIILNSFTDTLLFHPEQLSSSPSNI